jgi:hypothetical protein
LSDEERAELDGLGDCLRRHGAALPRTRSEKNPFTVPFPRPDDLGLREAAKACGLDDPPPGPDPFPLSDEEIAAQRAALEEFIECMRDRGQQLGEPEVDRDRIAIRLGPRAFDEEFLAAQRECGGPPPPPAP